MPFIELNGAAVEYQQSGSGPHLLLLHSLLTEMSVFDRVLPTLAKTHCVTRINLPGYGASMPRALHSVDDYADHVAAVMDVLKLPHETAVFGNGFGAFVALLLTIRHGERFNRLIIADVLATFPEPARVPFRTMAEKVRSHGMQAVLDAAIGRMFPPEFAAANPSEVALRKQALSQADAESFARVCLALSRLDTSQHLPKIKNPVMVICGALDLTTPPALARALALNIPKAEYRQIADCGHCPMVEQPALLVETMQAFLNK